MNWAGHNMVVWFCYRIQKFMWGRKISLKGERAILILLSCMMKVFLRLEMVQFCVKYFLRFGSKITLFKLDWMNVLRYWLL